jgi:hypothetical protein
VDTTDDAWWVSRFGQITKQNNTEWFPLTLTSRAYTIRILMYFYSSVSVSPSVLAVTKSYINLIRYGFNSEKWVLYLLECRHGTLKFQLMIIPYKEQERQADHSSPSNAEVKNGGSKLHCPICLHGIVFHYVIKYRDNSTLFSRNNYIKWPVTVAERSKAWSVFARADAGTVGSMFSVCVVCAFFCVCV